MDDQDVIREFLIESNENLARLDQEMVSLEKQPNDPQLLAGIFRTIHTIKGTCGFLGFSTLGAITHSAENILSQLREGARELTPNLVTLILEAVDAIKSVLISIESSGVEGPETYAELCSRLEDCAKNTTAPSMAPAAVPAFDSAKEIDGASQQKGQSVSDSTIRVDVGLLDKLMNLVGELVLARNQILQFNAQQEDSSLNATSQRLNLITTELQEGVMKTRMQPIGVLWNKLPRVVRDLAVSFGKQIQLKMDGAGTELDKTIIEAIKDPLTHIVRNCCDHGIEKPEVRIRGGKPSHGKLSLRAYHEGGQVNIEIGDDGAGMDVQRLKTVALQKGLIRPEQAERMSDREALGLIFAPGFSTSAEVTSISGRGVGMDVVKTNVEKIGGTVDLVSRPGQGTTIKLKIPLTLAIIPGLVVMVGERRTSPRTLSCEQPTGDRGGVDRFVIPQVSLLELIRLEGESGLRQIECIHDRPFYRRRGKLLPLVYLSQVLRLGEVTRSNVVNIVVVEAEERQFGLVVDGIADTQEIVVKPLGKQLKGLSCYAGATIMGDGRVALILDVLGIGQLAGIVQESREQSRAEGGTAAHSGNDQQTFLLFRAGSFERLSVPLCLVARLEEFPQIKIERASGRRVVQYRGQILPLAPLGPILEPDSPDTASARDPAQVVVFNNGDHRIGIMVDQILDIVEETVSVRRTAERKGLLGSAVIGKKVTDLLDLHAVIEQAGERWFDKREFQGSAGTTVMVAEGSAFERGLVRSSLEMAGYQVVEAADTQAALRVLEGRRIDVVLAALDLPSEGGFDLLNKMRSETDFMTIPALALASTVEETRERGKHPHDFDDYQLKFDRDGMLRSLAGLAAAVGSAQMTPSLELDRG